MVMLTGSDSTHGWVMAWGRLEVPWLVGDGNPGWAIRLPLDCPIMEWKGEGRARFQIT
jgi:hypothetical protein